MGKLKYIYEKSSSSMRKKHPFSKMESSPISITFPDKFIFLEGKEKAGRFSIDSIGVYDIPVEKSSMKKGNLFDLNLPNAHYSFFGEVKKDDIRISRSIGRDVFVTPAEAKKFGKVVKADWSDFDKLPLKQKSKQAKSKTIPKKNTKTVKSTKSKAPKKRFNKTKKK